MESKLIYISCMQLEQTIKNKHFSKNQTYEDNTTNKILLSWMDPNITLELKNLSLLIFPQHSPWDASQMGSQTSLETIILVWVNCLMLKFISFLNLS
jgi:hypothetical protein